MSHRQVANQDWISPVVRSTEREVEYRMGRIVYKVPHRLYLVADRCDLLRKQSLLISIRGVECSTLSFQLRSFGEVLGVLRQPGHELLCRDAPATFHLRSN